ncbi:MAG: N-acetyl-1-D-myo-inositol-2-amino-2-deoxy-alpha-D-glucopyranoside deacetylase [Aeromicrobium sp.]
MTLDDRRILLVHAHPDDESISNGASMARYVAEGAQVTLVTCTAGEEGEILIPEIEHLASDQDDALGPHRVKELEEAMALLGVTDHRFLGGEFHFRDSGMQWGSDGHAAALDESREGTFWHADLTQASNLLVEIIREVRPHVLVTYDEFGGYGHPDHIQAHRVATYGAVLASIATYRRDLGEPWDIPKVYWTAMSASAMREGLRTLREAGDTTTFEGMDPDNLPPFAVEDDDLDAMIDGSDFLEVKLDAMRAHASQIATDGPFFAFSNNVGNRVWGVEFYRLVKGTPAPPEGAGFEDDLFAGL